MTRELVRNTLIALGIAVALCATPYAQAKQGKKAAAKESKGSHSMTGCLQKGSEANTYTLANAEGNGPKTVEIVETAKGVDLAPHVGHKVTITGTKVSAKRAAKDEGVATKKEKKEEAGEHHMRVTKVEMVAATCS